MQSIIAFLTLNLFEFVDTKLIPKNLHPDAYQTLRPTVQYLVLYTSFM